MQIDQREWLEPDGLGGFASGTASSVRTRRYHGLLLTATTPPTGRMMLVNGFDAWVDTPAGSLSLSTQRYNPDVLHPDGLSRLERFSPDPWPTWTWRVGDDVRITQDLFVVPGASQVFVTWRLDGTLPNARLRVRPFLSGRDYHALHHENPVFNLNSAPDGDSVTWHPYADVPAVRSRSNGAYHHDPSWYRRFMYSEERARGLDDVEDLASPGFLEWDLTAGDAVWVLEPADRAKVEVEVERYAAGQRERERARRAAFPSRLHRAADAYLVRRGAGMTIVAGYPWFTDWGRDTFIALRGLCLAAGRLAEARDILLEWSGAVSEGMLPNRFPDAGEAPEYNAVDASLWFIVAVNDLLMTAGRRRIVSTADRRRLMNAVVQILEGYARGTRYGIRADEDGLLAAGAPGVQLTWMDAKVGDDVITPRIGKPVEVEALWLNAVAIGGRESSRWASLYEKGAEAFAARFWNESRGCLYDVVDVDHVAGRTDPALRPNQILAVGGLPIAILNGGRAKQVVDVVERELLAPLGLRTLAPGEPGYTGRYEGGVSARDRAYHQGTEWPWLIGPFVDAWIRSRGDTPDARREARQRFLDPLTAALDQCGLGHLPEIADGDAPFVPRGCPFQAWSLGELLRVTVALQD